MGKTKAEDHLASVINQEPLWVRSEMGQQLPPGESQNSPDCKWNGIDLKKVFKFL